MSTEKLKLVEYSDSSSEEDNGEDGKHMVDNQGQKSQLDSEVQKVQSDSEGQKFQDSEVQKGQSDSNVQKFQCDGSGRKVAVVEPRIIQQNVDESYDSNSLGEIEGEIVPASSPLPPAPPPSPENFLVSGSLTNSDLEDVAHILLDLSLSEVRPNNQEDQRFGQETEDTPIEINSSPLSDPVDDSEVINISSDSDSDAATIPYVTSPSPPSCEHDVWSIKSGTSGKSISILLKEWDGYFS